MMMGRPPAGGFPLDDYGDGLAAAYALHRLLSDYEGPAILVRRDSDNATLDIGFLADGSLDTAALLAHCGANSGYVVTWYDQSGLGRHFGQASAASQPRIVNAGAVETYEGRTAIYKPQGTRMDAAIPDLAQPFTLFTVHALPSAPGTSDYVWDSSGRVLLGSRSTEWSAYGGGFVQGAGRDTATHVFSVLYNGGVSSLRVDAATIGAGNIGSRSTGTRFEFGHSVDASANPDTYGLACVLYAADKSPDRAAIESVLNSSYNVY